MEKLRKMQKCRTCDLRQIEFVLHWVISCMPSASWNVHSNLHVSGIILQCGCWEKNSLNNRPRNCLFQPSLYDSKAIQCECLRSPPIVKIFLSHFPASLSSISCFNDQFKVVILSAQKTLFNRRSAEISKVAWRSKNFFLILFWGLFSWIYFRRLERVSTEAVGKVYAKV